MWGKSQSVWYPAPHWRFMTVRWRRPIQWDIRVISCRPLALCGRVSTTEGTRVGPRLQRWTLNAMPDKRKVEVGLKLRETKLCNGMLYSKEPWTNISEKEKERMEQVDLAALRTIIGGGHSRCPKPFYYLEYGLIMFRHIIMIRRINYHYHIVTREDTEIIKKVYMK